jgi:hypothetical protein
MSFVRGVLDPLRGANLVDDDLGDLVASKATDKIMARHEGACDADFLVGEYPQVRVPCHAAALATAALCNTLVIGPLV